MKRYIIILLILAILLFPFSVQTIHAKSQAQPFIEPKLVEMTYYTESGQPCANGKMPHFGICAYQSEYIGYTAIIYEYKDGAIGEKIGYFEIYDTGYGRKQSNGKGTIQNGNAIDVFMESDGAGKEFIKEHGNQVFIQILKGKG